MLKGSTPLDPRFSSLDISPALQAGAMEQQAIVDISSSINQAVQGIQEKQMQKKDQEMRMSALSPLLEQSGLAGSRGTETFNTALKQLSKDDNLLNSITKLQTLNVAKMEAQAKQVEAQAEYVKVAGQSSEGILPDLEAHFDVIIPGGPDGQGIVVKGGYREGTPVYYDPETGKHQPLPAGARENFDYTQEATQLNKSFADFEQESSAVKALEKYLDTRGDPDMPQGLDLLLNQITGKAKTLAGFENLTRKELLAQIGKGQFQGLLGRIRVDVLGPGVLTEFDAQRLEDALGRYGAGSSPEVVTSLIKEIIEDKKSKQANLYQNIEFYRGSHPDLFRRTQNRIDALNYSLPGQEPVVPANTETQPVPESLTTEQAIEFKGKTITDKNTGIKYYSDGQKWTRL